jgi:3-oxoacyl-[acyl-carrier-protein] synthase-3
MKLQVGITGVGYNVPPSIRTNDDPIFDWLHAHVKEELFKGFKERRVLPGPGTLSALEENVADLMISAAKQALARAETDAADVDLLLGWASISPYLTPNALTLVHRELRLRQNAWLIPVEGLENFSTALMLADSLIKADGRQCPGRFRVQLVAVRRLPHRAKYQRRRRRRRCGSW